MCVATPCAFVEAQDVELGDFGPEDLIDVQGPECELRIGLPLLRPAVGILSRGLGFKVRQRIRAASLRDQIRRIRNHPSIFTYWYGSDNPPNARAESNYLAVLKELNWPNPAQASATAKPPAVGAPTGIGAAAGGVARHAAR